MRSKQRSKLALLLRFIILALFMSSCAHTESMTPSAINPVVKIEVSFSQGTKQKGSGTGTGFFITDDGYLVTNDHVVNPTLNNRECSVDSLFIRIDPDTPRERRVKAKVVSSDPKADLAVVKASGIKHAPFLSLADLQGNPSGQHVTVRGYPGGGRYTETTGRILRTMEPNSRYSAQVLVSNAEAHPGNSGGPATDDMGLVLGVTVSKPKIEMIQIQEVAAAGMENMMAALAKASAKMKEQDDKNDFGARMDALGSQGRESLAQYRKKTPSWILEEAQKNPHMTFLISVKNLRERLHSWNISIPD